MDILKTAIDWTKAEMFSSTFFVLFGLVFVSASLYFWHLGRTDVAKAYVIPMLIAGTLLLIIGVGIFYQSYTRVTSFAELFDADAANFVASQVENANRVLHDYQIAVFRIMPLVIAVSAMLFLFLTSPIWRASLVTTIALLVVIILIDTNASARLEDYRLKLTEAAQRE